jgi:SAM-dependent methyltransferase
MTQGQSFYHPIFVWTPFLKTATGFFPPSSFNQLATAEAQNWWFCSRNQILLWVLKTHVGSFNRFLEIGCGTGFVLEEISKAFSAAKLHGSDYFAEGLVHARRRVLTASFTQLDARTMQDVDRYDAIGAFDVIEHINEDELVLANLSRALKRGGAMLITVPQHRWLWSAVDEYSCHVRRYTRKELMEKVKRSGLTVEYVTSFVSLLVPLMWLSRLRVSDTNFDPMKEFRIPVWLNRFLALFMSIELGLLKIGFRFPIGGSLLLCAKKI